MDLQLQPHPATSRDDKPNWPTRLALWLAEKAGATGLFYTLVIWYSSWIILATLHIGPFARDQYPFPLLLFMSNAIQLVYLPLLQIKSKYDAKINDKANTHIANVLDQIADHIGVEAPRPLTPESTARIRALAEKAAGTLAEIERDAGHSVIDI